MGKKKEKQTRNIYDCYEDALTGSFDKAGQLFEWLLQQPSHLESIPIEKEKQERFSVYLTTR